jgi:hypothetical protein
MGTGRKFNKTPVTRPKKCVRERARRLRTQKGRLTDAGVSDEEIKHMTPGDVRARLRDLARA